MYAKRFKKNFKNGTVKRYFADISKRLIFICLRFLHCLSVVLYTILARDDEAYLEFGQPYKTNRLDGPEFKRLRRPSPSSLSACQTIKNVCRRLAMSAHADFNGLEVESRLFDLLNDQKMILLDILYSSGFYR